MLLVMLHVCLFLLMSCQMPSVARFASQWHRKIRLVGTSKGGSSHQIDLWGYRNMEDLTTDQVEVKKVWKQHRPSKPEDGLIRRKRLQGKQLRSKWYCLNGLENKSWLWCRMKRSSWEKQSIGTCEIKIFFSQDEGGCRKIDKNWEYCLRRKQPTNQVACMSHLTSELVDMAIFWWPQRISEYAMAAAMRIQTAKTIARSLTELFIIHYHIPERLYIDQGANFTSHQTNGWDTQHI